MNPIRPPRLRAGGRVRLVAPAGPVGPERIERALARCRALGFEPELAASATLRDDYLAGPDDARARDLQDAIDDGAVAAIWALRGGYGMMRILDRLELAPLRERPRPFIGFSDNTALHTTLQRSGVVSFHGPHAGAGTFDDTTEACFRRVLCRAQPAGPLPADPDDEAVTLTPGTAEGPLAGGNLALLCATLGTPYAVRAPGAILFLEDVGEPLYRIDRMLTQLRLAGVLDDVAGLAFGRFTGGEADIDPDALRALLARCARTAGVPAVHGLPIGHAGSNWTIPLGIRARLDADSTSLSLLESAVT